MHQIIALARSHLPNCRALIGYGSAFSQQANRGSHQKTIDLLVLADDPQSFHTQNLVKNPDHYSGLGRLGWPFIKWMEEVHPIHFNNMVKFEQKPFKYGVVSTRHFVQDLESWCWLSLAGRMHKPVLFLQNNQFKDLFQKNYDSAFFTTCLIEQKPVVKLQEFLQRVVSLSYGGDVRKSAQIDRNKQSSIVQGNYEEIKKLYQQSINETFKNICALQNDSLYFDLDKIKLLRHANHLPSALLASLNQKKLTHPHAKDSLFLMSAKQIQVSLSQALWDTNARSSRRMAVRQFLSGSLLRNLRYVIGKYRK